MIKRQKAKKTERERTTQQPLRQNHKAQKKGGTPEEVMNELPYITPSFHEKIKKRKKKTITKNRVRDGILHIAFESRSTTLASGNYIGNDS